MRHTNENRHERLHGRVGEPPCPTELSVAVNFIRTFLDKRAHQLYWLDANTRARARRDRPRQLNRTRAVRAAPSISDYAKLLSRLQRQSVPRWGPPRDEIRELSRMRFDCAHLGNTLHGYANGPRVGRLTAKNLCRNVSGRFNDSLNLLRVAISSSSAPRFTRRFVQRGPVGDEHTFIHSSDVIIAIVIINVLQMRVRMMNSGVKAGCALREKTVGKWQMFIRSGY